MSNRKQHRQLVKRLAKPPQEIMKTFTVWRGAVTLNLFKNLWDAEASMDKAKKHIFYEKFTNELVEDKGVTGGQKQPITEQKINVMHAIYLIVGESLELSKPLILWCLNREELDKKNVVEELGDILFGIELLIMSLGMDIEKVRQSNIDKLKLRYPDGYSDANAKARKDKQDDE